MIKDHNKKYTCMCRQKEEEIKITDIVQIHLGYDATELEWLWGTAVSEQSMIEMLQEHVCTYCECASQKM